MKIILVFLIFLSSSTGIGQEIKATIYFRDGSSFEGFGYIYKNNQIKFRLESQEEYETWTDLLIKEIAFHSYSGSTLFRYVDLRNNSYYKLLKVLADGEFTLYAKMKNSYTTSSVGSNDLFRSAKVTSRVDGDYYLKRKNEKTYTKIVRIAHRKKIRKILNDCEDFTQRYDEGEFRKNTLQEIIEYYNDFCVE